MIFELTKWYLTSDGYRVKFIRSIEMDGQYNVFRHTEYHDFKPFYTDKDGKTAYGESIVSECKGPTYEKYEPETKWEIDGNLVYNLKFHKWNMGKPVMINDVAIKIETKQPDEIKNQIAKIIADALNKEFVINHPQNQLLKKVDIIKSDSKYWCCTAEFGKHTEDCPNQKSKKNKKIGLVNSD